MNGKNFCIRFLVAILVTFLSQISYAQGQMCWPVQTCTITSVSQSGETKVCWDRMECMNYPTGIIQTPSSSFSGSIPTPSASGTTIGSNEQKRLKCKLDLEKSLKSTKDALLRELRSNTSTCNNYHILAAVSGMVGAVAAVPTFGFTAAAGTSGAVSFATAGIICQQNADGRYAELVTHNEYVTKQFDLKVCDSFK